MLRPSSWRNKGPGSNPECPLGYRNVLYSSQIVVSDRTQLAPWCRAPESGVGRLWRQPRLDVLMRRDTHTHIIWFKFRLTQPAIWWYKSQSRPGFWEPAKTGPFQIRGFHFQGGRGQQMAIQNQNHQNHDKPNKTSQNQSTNQPHLHHDIMKTIHENLPTNWRTFQQPQLA